MTVYVDDAFTPWGRGKWSHLIADTLEELHDFAGGIGLRRAWFQDHPKHPHYDVTMTRRTMAIVAGAQPITGREAVAIIQRADVDLTQAALPQQELEELAAAPAPTLAELIEEMEACHPAALEYARLRRQVRQQLAARGLQPGRSYRIGDRRVTPKQISGGGYRVSSWTSTKYEIEAIEEAQR